MSYSSKTYTRFLFSTIFFITVSCHGPEKLDLTNIENEVITFYDDPVDEINFPSININTNGQEIVDDPKVNAGLVVVEDKIETNYNIGIEIRGSSSQMFPKKSYGFETKTSDFSDDLDVNLGGFPEEEDWILYGPYSDKSLIRNKLTFDLSNAIGFKASNTKFYNLFINGDSKGLYILMEKIKRDSNRVDISKNNSESVDAGYIIKIDKPTSEEGGCNTCYENSFSFRSSYDTNGNQSNDSEIYFIYDYPKPDNITDDQKQFIYSTINEFETILTSDNFDDPIEGYDNVIDVDTFIDISAMSDSDVVVLAREHNLDIAIDVNGYTRFSRSRLFAHRMAPIQINYLGYPSTMAVDFIDYIIGDNTIISAEQRAFYSENIIYMPDCYQPNDEKRKIAKISTSRSDFGLAENSFVFCCFNNNFKITPKEYDIWMRVMRQVENSVLWLFKASDIAEKNLKCEAEARGVNPERIIFAKKVSLEEHLARHKHADLFIDTFNYNAHTTASDALWSGLPIVTKQGQQFAARVAASLLNAAGLSELVTKTEGEYESLILALAQDKARLAGVKNKLHETRSSCPLFDTVRYTRYFEAGLEKAYQDYCDGITPSDIAVSSLPLSDSANGQS